jgi:4-diphosphocytidyl-2-C-methyl-D-erythritol kinase
VVVRPGFAPAKVNLFLHVGPPAADGYHPVCSLMTFADVGDEVSLVAGGAGLAIEGPFAAGLDAGADNLVSRAREALLALGGRIDATFGLRLTKQLPIAAGLGGGSADAAAALRLIRERVTPAPTDAELETIARSLGADVTACLASRPVVGTGRGDDLEPAPILPDLPAVLINPLVASPTGEVYRAYDAATSPQGAARPAAPGPIDSPRTAAAWLATCRNDLEAPAVRLRPAIGDALARLAAESETLLARMSGSGATCFALCESESDAATLAARLSAAEPGWWVRPTVLKGAAQP